MAENIYGINIKNLKTDYPGNITDKPFTTGASEALSNYSTMPYYEKDEDGNIIFQFDDNYNRFWNPLLFDEEYDKIKDGTIDATEFMNFYSTKTWGADFDSSELFEDLCLYLYNIDPSYACVSETVETDTTIAETEGTEETEETEGIEGTTGTEGTEGTTGTEAQQVKYDNQSIFDELINIAKSLEIDTEKYSESYTFEGLTGLIEEISGKIDDLRENQISLDNITEISKAEEVNKNILDLLNSDEFKKYGFEINSENSIDINVKEALNKLIELNDSLGLDLVTAQNALYGKQAEIFSKYAGDINSCIGENNQTTLLGRIYKQDKNGNKITYQQILNDNKETYNNLKGKDTLTDNQQAFVDNYEALKASLENVSNNYPGITADQFMGNISSPEEAIYVAFMICSEDGQTCKYSNLMRELNNGGYGLADKDDAYREFFDKVEDCDENNTDGWRFLTGAKSDKSIANDDIVTLEELGINVKEAKEQGLITDGDAFCKESDSYTISMVTSYHQISFGTSSTSYYPITNDYYNERYMRDNEGKIKVDENGNLLSYEYNGKTYLFKDNKSTVEKNSYYNCYFCLKKDNLYGTFTDENHNEVEYKYKEHNGILYDVELGAPVINLNASYGFYNICAAFDQTDKLTWMETTDKMEYLGYSKD